MLLLLIASLAQAPTPADTLERPVIQTHRRQGEIHIDGRLDEAEWQRPPASTTLLQSNPVEGAPATEDSEFWITYDDEAIYVAARFHDATPDSIISYLVRRDGSNQSDLFSVFLDPYHDGQTGYQFLVNAAGVQRDASLFNDNQSDPTWDGVWESAVGRFEGGWTTEVRIPISQLRIRDSDEQVWGVNFARGIGRRNEFSYTVPRRRQGSGFVSRFARLEGLEGLRPRRRFEVLPYVVARSRHAEVAPGNPFFDGSHQTATAGVDLRLGLGNLQLDATVNPDFGQVEVDPAVVNLTDFETRFQERRPFFVEGTNILRFGGGGLSRDPEYDWPVIDPFYSRRVGRRPSRRATGVDYVDTPGGVRILGAAKLTGKVGQWNLASLSALTDRTEARTAIAGGTSPTGRLEVEPLASYSVLRLQRDFSGGRSGIGVLGTHVQRNFDDPVLRDMVPGTSGFVGVDGWTTLDADREWVVSGWGGTSLLRGSAALLQGIQASPGHYFQRPDADHVEFDPTATSMAGSFARVQLNRQRGAVLFNAAVGAVSPGFDVNDAGFGSQTDIINSHVSSGYLWTRPGSWYQSASLTAGVFSSWDFGGRRTRTGINPSLNVTFTGFSSAYLTMEGTVEGSDIRATRGGPAITAPATFRAFTGWASDFRKPFHYGLNLALLSNGGGAAPGWQLQPFVQWRPTSFVNLRLTPVLMQERLAAQYVGTSPDPLATATYGNRYLFGDLDQHTLLAELRADWIFSPTASLELFVQPLVSSVAYQSIKELRAPDSYDFRTYGMEGSTIDREAGMVDPDGEGPAPSIQIGQPEFTFASLRGNAVFRWEYSTGSTLYLVWTQQRQDVSGIGAFRPRDAFGRLFDAGGENVFQVKISYWLSR